MMMFALPTPPALEAVYVPNAESEFDLSGLVKLWRGDCAVTVQLRTSAPADAGTWRAPAATTSSRPAREASLAVFVAPEEAAPPVGEIGPDDRVPHMLAAVRRLTGWSWERVAEAMGRSRQAVHGWTLGKEISRANLDRLSRLHATLVYVDRGGAGRNRAILTTAAADGSLVGDMLDAGRFDEVRALLGRGEGERGARERLRFAADVQQNDRGTHWFDRLAETRGEEQPVEFVTSGERKRLAVRRRG